MGRQVGRRFTGGEKIEGEGEPGGEKVVFFSFLSGNPVFKGKSCPHQKKPRPCTLIRPRVWPSVLLD